MYLKNLSRVKLKKKNPVSCPLDFSENASTVWSTLKRASINVSGTTHKTVAADRVIGGRVPLAAPSLPTAIPVKIETTSAVILLTVKGIALPRDMSARAVLGKAIGVVIPAIDITTDRSVHAALQIDGHARHVVRGKYILYSIP